MGLGRFVLQVGGLHEAGHAGAQEVQIGLFGGADSVDELISLPAVVARKLGMCLFEGLRPAAHRDGANELEGSIRAGGVVRVEGKPLLRGPVHPERQAGDQAAGPAGQKDVASQEACVEVVGHAFCLRRGRPQGLQRPIRATGGFEQERLPQPGGGGQFVVDLFPKFGQLDGGVASRFLRVVRRVF